MVHQGSGLSVALAKALAIGFWSAITAPFRGEDGAETAYRHVVLATMRTFFDAISVKQLQKLLTPGVVQRDYESCMKGQGKSPDTIDINGMKAFWVGNKHADNIVIYFPGGGYCIPTSWAHVSQVAALSDDLKHNGQDVGFLILSYDLPPAHRWPAQLAQAVSALQYVIEKLNKRPSNIILQGDSAGAHLALALLSHLAQPHPDSNIPALPLTDNIKGALFLCPWIDFDTTYESFTRNAKKDVFTARALERWGQSFLEDTPADPYMQPATNAPPGWWGKLPVNRIFIGAGADEVLVDSIMKFASSVKSEHPDTTFSLIHRDFHTVPINDFVLGFPPGTQFKNMALWLRDSFSQS